MKDLSAIEVGEILDIAFRYGQAPQAFEGRLSGVRVGLVFTAPSTRTRVSFWSAATALGCDVLHTGPEDLQLTTGETWSDTGKILATFLDAIVVRTNGPKKNLDELARHLPSIVNALTYEEHPTQAIADLCAMREYFGDIQGRRIAYLGAVNNTARALALLVCKSPLEQLDVYSPGGLGFAQEEVAALNAIAGSNVIYQYHSLPKEPGSVDAVYTTRWRSMGAASHDSDWLARHAEFAVNRDVITRLSGSTEAVFMHDQPAVRGQEVTSDVLDGTSVVSLVQKQVKHKESAAAAALLWVMGEF